MNLEDIKSGKKLLIEGDEVYLTKTFNFIKSMLEIPELITSEDIKKNNNHIMDEDTCKDLVRAQNHSLKIKLFKYLIKIMKKEEFKVSKEDIEYLISKLAEIYDDIQDPMLMSKITNIITRLDNDKILDIINKMILGTQEVANSSLRKSDRDLLKELGDSRIEEGASRVENCELFKFKSQEKEVEDFEK